MTGKKLFVTGTGTDVGKTYIAALLVKKLHESGAKSAYFKAAASGNALGADGKLLPGDAWQVKTVSGIAQPVAEMCPYVYKAAVSPHLAAQWEGNPVDSSEVLRRFDAVAAAHDFVTAEGAGGLLCPLRFDTQKTNIADFIAARDFPCVLVADAGLGTINAVALTAEAMRARGIRLKGTILNRFTAGNALHEDNAAMCERYAGVRVLCTVAEGDTDLALSTDALCALYE